MLERPVLPPAGLRQIAADVGGIYIASGLVAFVFAASGPVAIILAVGAQGGLAESDLASWIFGTASRWSFSGPFRAPCWSGRRWATCRLPK